MKTYRSIFVSDVHLGTKDCQADKLNNFLKHNTCDTLYLVGDIIDAWKIQRNRWRWKQSHTNVVRRVLGHAKRGTRVIYVAGNHDEFLRPMIPYGFSFGLIEIHNQIEHIGADGRHYLVVHGDLFDGITKRCQLESRVKCPCWKNCKNGGTCLRSNDSTESCACRAGDYGELCEFSINSYNSTNGSIYNSTTRSYYNSTTGNYCRETTCLNGKHIFFHFIILNHCCKNYKKGGSCYTYNSTEYCNCPFGFDGRYCELSKYSNCRNTTCYNGINYLIVIFFPFYYFKSLL